MREKKPELKQVSTEITFVWMVMQSGSFIRGFEDARRGVPFDWRVGASDSDHKDAAWNYERGRQFAFVAPISMPLLIRGRLNKTAEALFMAAYRRRIIL
jgi:hypothetical protein